MSRRRPRLSRLYPEQHARQGQADEARVFGVAHPGAVYLHMGQSYEVRELDLHERTAGEDRISGGLGSAVAGGGSGVAREPPMPATASTLPVGENSAAS